MITVLGILLAVTHLGTATEAMTQASYWHADTAVIRSAEQIAAYNQALMAQPELHLREVSEVEGAQAFGLVVRPTDIRYVPTHRIAAKVKKGPGCFDGHQESTLMPGEEVAILRDTLKGQWVWIEAWNDEGWVDANDIAVCSKEQMVAFAKREPFVVTLRVSDEKWKGEKMRVNAGTRLPVLPGGKVLIPWRDKKGRLTVDSVVVKGAVHEGYVPLSRKAVLDIAFRQLGNPYSWGGKDRYNDCSGLVESTYRCCGVKLPRNVKWMRLVPVGNREVKNKQQVQGMKVGDVFLSKTHAMIYLGEEKGEHFILHATCDYTDKNGKEAVANGTVVTSMSDLYIDTGVTLLDRILHILTLE